MRHSAEPLDFLAHLVVLRDLYQIRRLQLGGVQVIAKVVRQLPDKLHHFRHGDLDFSRTWFGGFGHGQNKIVAQPAGSASNNGLVVAWPELTKLALAGQQQPSSTQQEMF